MKKTALLTLAGFMLLGLTIFGLKTGFTFREVIRHTDALEYELPAPRVTPVSDPGRLNVLLLGIRGVDDPDGGLLSDAIVLISYRRSDGEVALTSLPRDIHLAMPNGTKARMNAAYALGEEWRWGGGGLVWAKRVAEDVSGVKIDQVVSVDFAAFEKIIDILGGVAVTLEKPFVEPTQWSGYPGFASSSGAFVLPAGKHVLDAKTALFYVRSRFSTSDFDRARRIQQVMTAAKEKAFSLGVLANPFKLFGLLGVLGTHVRTTATRQELQTLFSILARLKFSEVSHVVLDASPEGLLREDHIEGAYVLLPRDGTFEKIREKVRHIFEQ